MIKRLTRYSLLAAAAALAVPSAALAQSDEASLERGAIPDASARQRYQSAIREAGGGLKVGLAECRAQAEQRKACEADAHARYKADMRQAQELLRNPQAGPVNEVGGPIRSTETDIITKP